jgi:hypothetical protein
VSPSSVSPPRRSGVSGTFGAALAAVGLGAAGLALPAAARAAVPVDARVQGTFAMVARVTAAVNVRGEHRGQRLRRRWEITPLNCRGSVCDRLQLSRQRSGHRVDRVTLRRVGRGRYAGSGVFYVALRCSGRVYSRGSRVPYRITITVTGTTEVQQISFARRIRATYVNRRRSDATPCPLGASHDAARYIGSDSTPVPTPPTASFSEQEQDATGTVAFTDTSRLGTGGARIVGWRWDFGDPASGAANTSADPGPSHQYGTSGTYTVSLTVLDANGLISTVQQAVAVTVLPYPVG